MLENPSESTGGAPPEDDERLAALLQAWRGVEPKAGFGPQVWRRIRAAPAARRSSLEAALHTRWGSRFAWANALGAAAGIVVGVGLAFAAPGLHVDREVGEPLLHPRTLAGSYLSMMGGGAR